MHASNRKGPTFLAGWRLVAFGVLVGALVPAAGGGETAAELRSVLSRLPDKQTACGALIVDLQTGKPVYSRSANTPMVPRTAWLIITPALAPDTTTLANRNEMAPTNKPSSAA